MRVVMRALRWPAGLRAALGVGALIAYMALSTRLMAAQASAPWTLALVLGPLALAIVGGVWRAGLHRLAGVVAVVIVATAAAISARTASSAQLLYLAQHAGVHAALAAWFASTLRPGHVPLIAQFAARVHGLTELPPAMAAYTRATTVAWVAYFMAMAAASIALYAWAPYRAWIVFANFFTPIGVALVMLGEHLLRYRLHPEFERIAIADAWRAWQQHPAPRSPRNPDPDSLRRTRHHG
ncbi:MAG TPA: hypothetical protein VMU33_14460 [Burkholderiaceae bacterium]|nr:hypothetical protein [Burkholderiaceae bacterium]